MVNLKKIILYKNNFLFRFLERRDLFADTNVSHEIIDLQKEIFTKFPEKKTIIFSTVSNHTIHFVLFTQSFRKYKKNV